MKFASICLSALAAITFATAAYAMDLQTAKSQGLVGELTNGYIGAVANSPEVASLVNSVNTQRKQAYQAISRENNQQLQVVETLAAKKLYGKLQAGEYYQSGNGSWQRK